MKRKKNKFKECIDEWSTTGMTTTIRRDSEWKSKKEKKKMKKIQIRIETGVKNCCQTLGPQEKKKIK